MKRVIVVAGWLGVLAVPAVVQPKVVQEPDKTIVRKKTVVDFTDVRVDGDLSKPEGSYVLDRMRAGFPTRVKVRASFAPELQKSVDNL